SWRLAEIIPKMARDPEADVTEAYTKFLHGEVIGANPPTMQSHVASHTTGVDAKSLEKVAMAIKGYVDRGFLAVGKVLRAHKARTDELEARTKELETK